MEKYRVGLGFDLHKISEEKQFLLLGGFKIDCGLGLIAVSDADVVLHAIADAICGASSLGDIGDYFPPSDQKNKGIDSKKIVNSILAKIKNNYKLVNIDITIVSERPRLVAYKKEILQSLKDIFKIEDINLKIKSKEATEVLGGVDAMSCLAAVLVAKI
ncbi:MAG: 2-C-methyl-D-erythritol 2,4-cyclodiphosphate synthase [Candidatus Omnitrophica bacterium]|nr:2-C-methyl-D-erythritol 2,4-cyclodiphosphate synthase [Candidatus Omnitrophota bacterium]